MPDRQMLVCISPLPFVISQMTCAGHIECLNNLSETTLRLLYVQGKYTVLWATAQQVSSKQKVEASIRCVLVIHRLRHFLIFRLL